MIMIFQRNLIFQNPQEQLEQLREQRRQLAQLQRTAAAPTTSRRESFRLIDCGYIHIWWSRCWWWWWAWFASFNLQAVTWLASSRLTRCLGCSREIMPMQISGLCPPSATPPLLSPTSATARRRAATPSAISWSTTSYNIRFSCLQVISYQLHNSVKADHCQLYLPSSWLILNQPHVCHWVK